MSCSRTLQLFLGADSFKVAGSSFRLTFFGPIDLGARKEVKDWYFYNWRSQGLAFIFCLQKNLKWFNLYQKLLIDICTIAETIFIYFPQNVAVLTFPLHKCSTFRKMFLLWENIFFLQISARFAICYWDKYNLVFGQKQFCIWTKTILYLDTI